LCALSVALAATSCTAEEDPTLNQRALGEATMVNTNALIEASPALITAVDDANATLSARLSAPVGRMTVRTNGRAQGALTFNLTNLHPAATARLVASQAVAASASFDTEACPRVVSGETTCEGDPACLPPTLVHDPDVPTRATLTIPIPACRRIVVEVAPPAQDTIRFALIGSLDEPARLDALLAAALEREPALDFAVQLGDSADSGAEALELLAQAASRASVPLVMLPGEREAGDAADASRWQRKFGPFDLRWTWSSVQFLAFSSVGGTLPTRGINNLESALRAMRDERAAQARLAATPLKQGTLALTHVPPFDPSGLREDGFVDRLEAARVMSLLGRYGVQYLFAGHLHRAGTLDATIPTYITTARSLPFSETAEYMLITISSQPLPSSTRRAGDLYIDIERVAAP
jgi:hypothetical protein